MRAENNIIRPPASHAYPQTAVYCWRQSTVVCRNSTAISASKRANVSMKSFTKYISSDMEHWNVKVDSNPVGQCIGLEIRVRTHRRTNRSKT